VEVAEEQRTPKRFTVEELGEVADAGASVEYQRGGFTVSGECDARRVAAVADEVLSGRGRRAPDAEEVNPHDLP
jgi:hypothetical protein